ncbi:MAG TPA: hypothetical protein VN950_00880 [Terriglobales bacterium]|nr:hypothetical protein [Terriglobales bacterium]
MNKTQAQKIIGNRARNDWALRAHSLLFYIHKGAPIFGNASD